MAKDFYIFRHGETELNRRRRWQGSGTDYDLTEDGVSQAEELSAKLAGKGIEVIYSSPLLRARHTAEIAARMLKVPVKTEADLRECFYGEAEGRPIAELQKEMPEIVNNWSRPGGDLRFPGGESRQEALERVPFCADWKAKVFGRRAWPFTAAPWRRCSIISVISLTKYQTAPFFGCILKTVRGRSRETFFRPVRNKRE